MAKMFASDTAMDAATEAVQIFGGYGYTREYPVERYFRDAKITRNYEGTDEIQRIVIAGELMKARWKVGRRRDNGVRERRDRADEPSPILADCGRMTRFGRGKGLLSDQGSFVKKRDGGDRRWSFD